MAPVVPEELLRQLESLDADTIAALPESLRGRLCIASKKCSFALESPTEVVVRLLLTQPTEAVYIRVATDILLFKALGERALTIPEIAAATNAEPELLEYLLRGLNAFGVVRRVGSHQFAASPQYALLQDETFEKAFPQCQDFLTKTTGSWPAFLRSINHQCPHDGRDTAVQYAFDAKGKSFWELFNDDPTRLELLKSISVLIFVWAGGFTQVQDLYPIKTRLEVGFDSNTVMFVDLGGNYGQKALALKKACPDLPGKFVVQDLPQVVERAPKDDSLFHEDIEMMAHDFFMENPIKGARCYYLRQVLHDWQDADVIKILKRVQEACKPGYSRILVHEIVVQDKDVKSWVACQDVNMLSLFALGERTEANWRVLCEKAGLKFSRVYTSDNPYSEAIVEMEV